MSKEKPHPDGIHKFLSVIFGVIAIFLLFILFSYLIPPMFKVYHTENVLQGNFTQPNSVTFPTFEYYPIENTTSGQGDISVTITLSYTGTLVAGQDYPIRLGANATVHTFTPSNGTLVIIGFQDALKYPRNPAQTTPATGMVSLNLSSSDSNLLTGSGMIYFPLAGGYSPTVRLVMTTHTTNETISHGYPELVATNLILQVQPTTILEDQQIAIANLQLTIALYIISVLGFAAFIFGALREAWKIYSKNEI